VGKLRGLGVPLLVLVVTPPRQIKLDAGPLRDQPECFHLLEIGDIPQTLAKLTANTGEPQMSQVRSYRVEMLK